MLLLLELLFEFAVRLVLLEVPRAADLFLLGLAATADAFRDAYLATAFLTVWRIAGDLMADAA